MEKLNILWTTTNRDTITNMIAMYAVNSLKKEFWEEVNIIVWGASVKLLGENKELQEEVKEMMNQGVNIAACKSCSDQYGATETLEALDIAVEYMGEQLTTILKEDAKLLTI